MPVPRDSSPARARRASAGLSRRRERSHERRPMSLPDLPASQPEANRAGRKIRGPGRRVPRNKALSWKTEETMARAIWTGSISFGLLNVPVRLYSAVSRKSVSFRELRASDSSRVRHKRVAEADGEEVPYEEIVKGYEIAPEQYVVLTRDELEELDPKKTQGDRDPGLRRSRRDRPDLLRPPLLPRARQGRREGLRAARQGDGRLEQGRGRPLRAAKPREPRGDPADGQGADDGDDAVRRRGRLARGARRRHPRGRQEARASARSRWPGS